MIALRANDSPLRGMIVCLRQNEGRFSPRRKSKLNKVLIHCSKSRMRIFIITFRAFARKVTFILPQANYHSREARSSFCEADHHSPAGRSSFDRREIIIRPQGDYSSLTLAAKLLLSFPHKTPSRVPFLKQVRRLRRGARCRPFAYI